MHADIHKFPGELSPLKVRQGERLVQRHKWHTGSSGECARRPLLTGIREGLERSESGDGWSLIVNGC